LQVASVKLGQEASEAAAAAVLEARATGASEEEVKVRCHCTLHKRFLCQMQQDGHFSCGVDMRPAAELA
jgi:hypothetical protein